MCKKPLTLPQPRRNKKYFIVGKITDISLVARRRRCRRCRRCRRRRHRRHRCRLTKHIFSYC